MNPAQLYSQLYKEFGPQFWWPVTEPGEFAPTYKKRKELSEKQRFEICVGAILTQNTDWKNVMKALQNLNMTKMMCCAKIASTKQEKIALLIKPSGYFNQKAKKLKGFCNYLEKNYSGSTKKLFTKPTAALRAELLSLHGIGNETADSILCYAAARPVFVVDAYTMRLIERVFAQSVLVYVAVQSFFSENLPKDAKLLNEFHALIVEFAKRYCRKQPLCEKCFLKSECTYARSKWRVQKE